MKRESIVVGEKIERELCSVPRKSVPRTPVQPERRLVANHGGSSRQILGMLLQKEAGEYDTGFLKKVAPCRSEHDRRRL